MAAIAASMLVLSLRLRLLPYSRFRYWALTGLMPSKDLPLSHWWT